MSFPKISLFRQDRWKAALFDTERLQALQELEIKLALDEERNPCHVKFWPQQENPKELAGEYRINPQTGTREIRVNPDIVQNEKPFQAVETQIKYSRQAYQEKEIGNRSIKAQVNSWGTNRANYFEHPGNTRSTDYVMHKYQPLEVDKTEAAQQGMDWTYKEYFPDSDYLDFRAQMDEQDKMDRVYAEGVLSDEPGATVEDKVHSIIDRMGLEKSNANEANKVQGQINSSSQLNEDITQTSEQASLRESLDHHDPIGVGDIDGENTVQEKLSTENMEQDENYYYGLGL